MNDSKFTELVNAYFDREITFAELECLRKELAANSERRHEFEIRYRLHKAMCAALSVDGIKTTRHDKLIFQKADWTNIFVGLFGFGIAACVAVSLILSVSIFRETNSKLQLSNRDLLNRSEIERYVENRVVREHSRGSLASQLRLMGLTPDIVPDEPQLSNVDMESLRQREILRQRAIDRINQYKMYSTLSNLKLNASQSSDAETNSQLLPAGFQSTLASF